MIPLAFEKTFEKNQNVGRGNDLNCLVNRGRLLRANHLERFQVLASAGAGKTRVLTERVRFILKNTKREGVIALTFTNKAAEEMHSRLSDLRRGSKKGHG